MPQLVVQLVMAINTPISCGLLLAGLLVGGCSFGPSQAEIDARNAELRVQMDAAVDGCRARSKKRADTARCVNEAENRIFGVGQDADLVSVMHAARVSFASKVDSGEMSDADAQLQFAQMRAKLVSEAQNRSLGQQQVNAQERASRAAMWQAINGNRVNCTRYGNSVSCY